MESKWMMNFSLLVVEISLGAKFIAQISAGVFFKVFL